MNQNDENKDIEPKDETASSTEEISLFELLAEDGELTDDALLDDAPTETLSDIPAITPSPVSPSPRPLLIDVEPLAQRPLHQDPEATIVQPRVAFSDKVEPPPPGDAPTQPHRIIKPTADPNKTMPSGQPVRAMPTRPPMQDIPVRPPIRQSTQTPPPRVVPGNTPLPSPKPRKDRAGCIKRFLLIGGMMIIVLFALLSVVAAFAYRSIAVDLPESDDLLDHISAFETARIYDRDGNEIYALSDPNSGKRTYVPLDQISPILRQATIATEDANFYSHQGFDLGGIIKAILRAAREGEIQGGASTITQQLVRAILLDEEERTERSFRRKVREIILAAELTRTYEKDLILEIYLNEIYYGNRSYGIEAASQTYFNKSARDLTLAEASLLAGLPQAPAWWEPYGAPDKAIGRQLQVLNLMVDEGYITAAEAQAALNEMNIRVLAMSPPTVGAIKYPHFIFTVLRQAEELLGAQAIYRGGLNIYTTLDPEAQRLAEQSVTSQRDTINGYGGNNAALIAVQPDTGEILALVGSMDFNDETIDGQVNMAFAPRQPGSSIKPLVYLSAMERGWTPATLIWDVETAFPNGANPPYVPKNYDDEFHGAMRLRPSLGNSYNIPAVKGMEFVGVCNFIEDVQALGLTSLQDDGCAEQGVPRNYGLALALGGGEIPPIEMAGAFNTFASQGRYVAPFSITRIEDHGGTVLHEHEQTAVEAISRDHAYLLNDMLSDNNARQPEFGTNNNLVIGGHRAAAKTGTSGSNAGDVRDAWTIGYTPQVVTAVWVGNTDNSPMARGASGYTLASPIWNSFMNGYLAGKPPIDFIRPPSVVDVEICVDSGTRPSEGCRGRMIERFAGDQMPLPVEDDFFQKVAIDLWTGLRATEACTEAVYPANFFHLLVSGRDEVLAREETGARRWLETTGGGQYWTGQRGVTTPLQLPPSESCDEGTERPLIDITTPREGDDVEGVVRLAGSVSAPNMHGYLVDYGISHHPGGWGNVQELRESGGVQGEQLALWDSTQTDAEGPITFLISIIGPDNPHTPEEDRVRFEKRVHVMLRLPTPTPAPTSTSTPTATATGTSTPTPMSTITPTLPAVTAVPTIEATVTTAVGTPTAVVTPTAVDTPTPTAAATATATITLPPTATPETYP